jgi:hypothetical protein
VTRDRLPGFAVLLLFAGYGVRCLIDAVRPGKSALFRAQVLGALLAAAAVTHWPLPDNGRRHFAVWMEACNHGDAYEQIWQRTRRPETLAAAVDAFENALRIDPRRLQPLKQLPLLYAHSGKVEEAYRTQRRLVDELRARYPRSVRMRARELEVAGKLAMQSAHAGEALALAREWRGLSVLELDAMDLEAVALAATGDRTGALTVAWERRRRSPGDPQAQRLIEILTQQR